VPPSLLPASQPAMLDAALSPASPVLGGQPLRPMCRDASQGACRRSGSSSCSPSSSRSSIGSLRETPRPRRNRAGGPWRVLDNAAGEGDCGGAQQEHSDMDESLAQAASSLDISCDAGTEFSMGDMIPSGARGLGSSAGWSPATVDGCSRSRRKSKRRSISDLSDSARMTPKELEERGMGVPWRRPTAGLCSVNLQGAEAEAARNFCLLPSPELGRQRATNAQVAQDEEARNFCLLPSPELAMRRAPNAQSSPVTPSSPGAMQRRFLDRVRRANLFATPNSAERQAGDCPFTPMEDPSAGPSPISFTQSPPPPTPPPMPTQQLRRSLGDSLASTASPVPRTSSPDSDASAAVLSVGNHGTRDPAQLHTAFRAQEHERLQLGTCRVKPQISKAGRRLSGGSLAVQRHRTKSQRQRPVGRMLTCVRPAARGMDGAAVRRALSRRSGHHGASVE